MSTKESIDTEAEVLELSLGENRFGVDIREVVEIVERTSLTPLPNSPPHVAGVMDLRGETTKIIDPKKVLDVVGSDTGERVIILDLADQTQVGWIVDGVYQVFNVDQYEIDEVTDNPALKGIIQRDGTFVMWIDPQSVIE